MTAADFGSIALAFITAISLIYVSRQVNATRLQAKGEFIQALDRQFRDYNRIGIDIIRNRQHFAPKSDDWREIIGYMGVFERMNIMVEDKILDIALVDRLYGSRPILLLSSDEVYQMVSESGAEWRDFIHLCRRIADHRRQVHVADYDQPFIERASKLTTDTIVDGDLWSARFTNQAD